MPSTRDPGFDPRMVTITHLLINNVMGKTFKKGKKENEFRKEKDNVGKLPKMKPFTKKERV